MSPELGDRLRRHATPLRTTAHDGDTADLAAIDDHLTDAAVVGLGEPVHGVRECHALVHRLIARLVEEHGCRLVALETHFSEARAVDEYVVDGEGTAEDALADLSFWVWQTEAARDLVEWIREFNRDRPPEDRVRFYGIDCQSTRAPARKVGEYLETVDPEFRESVEGALSVAREGVQPINRDDEADAPDDVVRDRVETVRDLAADLAARFEREREAYVAARSERAYRLASGHVRHLEAAADLADLDREHGRGLAYGMRRDDLMAETVAWIREHEDRERIAVWAANGHLRRGNDHHDDPVENEGPLGYHLDREFGDDYRAVAHDFGTGGARSVDATDDEVTFPEQPYVDPPADSLVGRLDDALSSPAVVDLAAAAADDVLAPVFEGRQRLHGAGPGYSPDPSVEDQLMGFDLPREFDALCFAPEGSPSRLLPAVRE